MAGKEIEIKTIKRINQPKDSFGK